MSVKVRQNIVKKWIYRKNKNRLLQNEIKIYFAAALFCKTK